MAGDGSKAKEQIGKQKRFGRGREQGQRTNRWLLKPLAANLILVVQNLLAVSGNRHLQVLLPGVKMAGDRFKKEDGIERLCNELGGNFANFISYTLFYKNV